MKTKHEELELEAEIEESEKKKKSKSKPKKKKDKISRWSGFILFLMVLIVGFVLWVAGEMGSL